MSFTLSRKSADTELNGNVFASLRKITVGIKLLDLPEEAAVSAVTDAYLFIITNNFNYSLKAGRHASWRNITAKVILSNITQVRKAATEDANIVFNRSVRRCIHSQVLVFGI